MCMILFLWKQSRSIYRAVDTLRETERTLNDEIELRNEFISVASHELRTPLTPVRMELDLVGRLARENKIGLFSQKKLISMNDISVRELENIDKIIQNYLDVVKFSHGHFPLIIKEFDLLEFLNNISQRFSESLGMNNEGIRIVGKDRLPVSWDPYRIEQVVTLLINNAMKQSQGRGIDIHIETINDTIKLLIAGRGPSLSQEDQTMVFKRFDQIKPDRIVQEQGMGLYIVRRIIEDHGGTIQVKSNTEFGTIFIINMPRIANPVKKAV